MALVRNPLLSLGARGKIADRFSCQQTTAGNRIIPYSKPTGLPSAAQVTRRQYMSNVSSNWLTSFNAEEIVLSWNVYAKVKDKRLTAANFFIRSALSLTWDGSIPAFVASATTVGRVAVFYFLNPYSSAVSSEAGNFSIKMGTSLTSMLFQPTRTIKDGMIIGPVSAIAVTFLFQIFKDGVPRSGIISLTHTQAATYEQLLNAGITWDALLNAGITWDDLL